MRIVNKHGKDITEYDLSKGKLVLTKIIKKDATPIDNITKFAWTKDDFEEVQMYVPYQEKSIKEQIKELKNKLSSSDYKIIKCAECQLLGQELPYDLVALHKERQALRDSINILEQRMTE